MAAFDILFEREEAVAALSGLCERVREGQGGSLFVVGEAGLGKTAVLALAAELAGPEVAIERAWGSFMETELPLAYIEQLLGPLDEAGESPERWVDPAELRIKAHHWARTRLRALAGTGPLVMVADDLHWADPSSLSILGFVCRRLSGLGVGLVAGLRPWPRASMDLAADLEGTGLARVVHLDRLTPSSSRLLLERFSQLPAPEEPVSEALALASGSPFLLKEAARSLGAAGGALGESTAGHAEMCRSLLLGCLRGLPPGAVTCAQAASVICCKAGMAALEAVGDIEGAAFGRAIDTLSAEGILIVTEGRVEFRHDLLSLAVYEDIPPGTRLSMHRRAFEYFLNARDYAAAAPHAAGAELVGDQRAVDALAAAARSSFARGAFEEAATQFGVAVRLAGGELGDDILLDYGQALLNTSRPRMAGAIYGRMLERDLDEDSRAWARLGSAQAMRYLGDFAGAQQAYQVLLEQAQPEALRVRVAAEYSRLLWFVNGHCDALSCLEGLDELVRLPGGEVIQALTNFNRVANGDASGIDWLESTAMALRTQATQSQQWGLLADTNVFALLASCYCLLERYDQVMDVVEVGTEWLRTNNAPQTAVVPLLFTRLRVFIRTGQLVTALIQADDIEEEIGESELWTPDLMAERAHALAWLGRFEEATDQLDRLARMAGTIPRSVRIRSAWAHGEISLLRGDNPATAANSLARAEHQVRTGGVDPCTVGWAATAIEAALAGNRMETVERLLALLEESSAPPGVSWPRMVGLATRAGLAAASGETASADELYQEALALACPLLLYRARIMLRYGRWLRRSGRPGDARTWLSEAWKQASTCGALPLAEAAGAELVAAGGRRRAGQRPSELTGRERQVAELAMTGATAREVAAKLFLSPRTVESHLSRVFTKLGVTSKAELRTRWNEPVGG